MPKENKKRGRRDEKKRRREDELENQSSKKLRTDGGVESPINEQPNLSEDLATPGGETPFYGLLDEEEQEYFKRADQMLEVNQFDGEEERKLFLENVYREADGKELKIANSQSCSRLMERLIMLSSPAQLKNLFGKFSGHFLHLVQHRFASHCCETLFIQSAPVVTQELTASFDEGQPSDSMGDEVFVSMENLFLYTLNELEGNLGYLMTDRFASHTLRVLLIVLSGQPLAKSSVRTLLQSRKKEKIEVAAGLVDATDAELRLQKRAVPESFSFAVEKITTDTIAGLDTNYLRALATHPTGNPVLQLLLELELTKLGKQKAKDEKSLFRRLLPDDSPTEGTQSASFINGLIYDPIGSRLLETILVFSPGKTFRVLYRTHFKPRMGSLARNETAGYVVIKILERLSKEDLEEAITLIEPQFGSLIERSRTALIRRLIERCTVRGADTSVIAKSMKEAYGPEPVERLNKILAIEDEGKDENPKPKGGDVRPKPEKLHGSLLAQTMLSTPGPLAEFIFESLSALPVPSLLALATDKNASRVLQMSLTGATANTQYRRRMVQQFFGHIGELATNTAGSHLVDALWQASQGLTFIRERIAEELLQDETQLRESHWGRAVWRNWMMDLYKRHKVEWINQAKAADGQMKGWNAAESVPQGQDNIATDKAKKPKSRLELARAKFAAGKLMEKPSKPKQGRGEAVRV